MPVKIVFRTSKNRSPFRDLLLALITSPVGDSILLCSGYIWEPSEDSSQYAILDDDLLDAIKDGCSEGIVITVAGKFSEQMWEDHYRNFVTRLNDSGVRVNPFIAPRRNWHAKIAIRLGNGKPQAALVGSSNLTGPAYRLNSQRWNFEGDVLIWPPNKKLNSYFRDSRVQIGNLDLILDPEVVQPNEQTQLQGLYDGIITAELEQFNIG